MPGSVTSYPIVRRSWLPLATCPVYGPGHGAVSSHRRPRSNRASCRLAPSVLRPFRLLTRKLATPGDPPAKRSILTAALALFASRGIDGVSIRDIAADSGFSNPAMFKYYKSKEDLARTLFEACYRPTTAIRRSAAAGAGVWVVGRNPSRTRSLAERSRWPPHVADARSALSRRFERVGQVDVLVVTASGAAACCFVGQCVSSHPRRRPRASQRARRLNRASKQRSDDPS